MKFQVNLSTYADIPEIHAFYSQNPHPFFVYRENPSRLICGDAGVVVIRQDRQVVGCSAVFQHQTQDGRMIAELGQNRILPSGFHLLRLADNLRILMAYKGQTKPSMLFRQVCVQDVELNSESARMGFTRFTPRQEVAELANALLPQDEQARIRQEGTHYWLGSPNLQKQALWYFQQHQHGHCLIQTGEQGTAFVTLGEDVQHLIARSREALQGLETAA